MDTSQEGNVRCGSCDGGLWNKTFPPNPLPLLTLCSGEVTQPLWALVSSVVLSSIHSTNHSASFTELW